MEIVLLSDDKLKISISKKDIEELGLPLESMDYTSEKTRRTLHSLLESAKAEVGFSPRGARLFVEVYESEAGGRVIYFTSIKRPVRLPDSQRVISPSIFEFENADDLIDGACGVFLNYSHRIYKSSLYLLNGKYRLLVYNLDYSDNLSVHFLSEYAKKLGEDEILAAYTAEHGKELIADSALDTLAKYFS